VSNASVDAFRARLRQTISAQRAICRNEIMQQGEGLLDAIRKAAPDRTGRLRSSIQLQISPDGMSATILAGEGIENLTVPISHHREIEMRDGAIHERRTTGIHAHILAINLQGLAGQTGSKERTAYEYILSTEFGSRHESAHPFFFPTYRARRRSIAAAIGNAMLAPLRALWG
jgi:hypothetical protein